ncbi:MAG: glycosyltransferase [Rubellimicrobium sp.]|nr:glycosyltransferase [Rubellimicrobium sp.]
MQDMEQEFAALGQELASIRYLLVSPVPWFRDAEGGVWLDLLWQRDLWRHLDYLTDLTVLAPCRPAEGNTGLVRVDPPPGLRFKAFPQGQSIRQALFRLPRMIRVAVGAIRQADLVHSGMAGWPIPPGLVVNPLAGLLRRPIVIVVESAFWRLSGPGPHGAAARLRAAVTERLARSSVCRAALTVVTHQGYRDALAAGVRGEVLVTPASWLDSGDMVTDIDGTLAARPDEVRLILAGRLVPEKGVATLIAAIEALEAAGQSPTIDVIGEGPMREDLASLAARLRHVRLTLRDPVPYGAPFLSLLRGYHAIIVPSLSDEQPRVIADAAGQAVPALASDTAGHRELVTDGVTGRLFPPGDAAALAACLSGAAQDAAALADLGRAARHRVDGLTHQQMHLVRARALAALVRQRKIGSSAS